ncbi:MAG TPA: antirestriction protein ArdA, partial [Hyphomonadaceae bacterium]|nr:antirestriction protein ArdA [Hyphomonadaceae bacterium]
WDQINEVLKTSPMPDAEEWAIHDYEGFEGLSISEYEGIQSVVEKAEFIEEHGRLGAEVVNHYGDFETAKRALEDDYAGQYDSLADFAQEITEETSEVPNHLQYYIDWERMGRDLEINDVLAIDMGYREVHVFWNR